MREFTEHERELITSAYRKKENSEPLDSDELDLLIEFERERAVFEESAQVEREAIAQTYEVEQEQRIKTEETARDNLQTLVKLARERYERSFSDE